MPLSPEILRFIKSSEEPFLDHLTIMHAKYNWEIVLREVNPSKRLDSAPYYYCLHLLLFTVFLFVVPIAYLALAFE